MDFLAKMGVRSAINELYGGHIGGQIGVAFRARLRIDEPAVGVGWPKALTATTNPVSPKGLNSFEPETPGMAPTLAGLGISVTPCRRGLRALLVVPIVGGAGAPTVCSC